MSGKQDCKVFTGGLSWETTSDRLKGYFENYGVVREAFISINPTNGKPRGFGFVTFESPEVAKKVIAVAKHTIDRREVEAKESFAKEEQSSSSQDCSDGNSTKNKKLFVGGLAPAVDENVLREHFETYGPVGSAEVILDHDSKRPRGFGFVTFVNDESLEKVFELGTMHTILEKQVEIKVATPRDQMPSGAHRHSQVPMGMGRGAFDPNRAMMQQQQQQQQRNGRFYPGQMPYGQYPGGPGGPGYGHRPQQGAPGPHGIARGPSNRGPPIGPGGFNQGQHRGPGFGNFGNGEANFGMDVAALLNLAALAQPRQLPDFQGPVPLQQLQTSLASLAVQPTEPASGNNRINGTNSGPEPSPGLDSSTPGLDFYKSATMGPGWSS
eukprot:gene24261-9862_t